MFAVGCQSMGMGASAAPTKALLISGQGGTTVVVLPTADGGVQMMSTSADFHKCPQCEADAKEYFKTGKIDPKCSVCGAIRTPLADYSKVGHQ